MKVVVASEVFRNDHQKHQIPLGQVVEIEYDSGTAPWNIQYSNGKDIYSGPRYDLENHCHITPPPEYKEICLGITGKVKAIIVGHTRDCDGTPLYVVSDQPIGYPRGGLATAMEYRRWTNFLATGFSEESIKVCQGEVIPIRYQDIEHYKQAILSTISKP